MRPHGLERLAAIPQFDTKPRETGPPRYR